MHEFDRYKALQKDLILALRVLVLHWEVLLERFRLQVY